MTGLRASPQGRPATALGAVRRTRVLPGTRPRLALGIAVSTEIEDEMADWVGRVHAIAEDVVESPVTSHGLILFEGAYQTIERFHGDVVAFDCTL